MSVPEEITTAEQARAVYLRAADLYHRGDFPGAIGLCNKLVDLGLLHSILRHAGIDLYNVRELRAMAYCKVGRFAEAEQELQDVLAYLRSLGIVPLGSTPAMYWYLVARYKGDKKKAMDEFMKL